MAVNKRKVLEAARKYVQKGNKAKALKEFQTLLKADPKDGRLRLEIGDAHRRWGQADEAIEQYTKVADQYTQDGFDARAVAVYKQILNLDSKRLTAMVSLGDLYQRMGLDSEAASALQGAAAGYQKEGKKREALELLRKMATLDPTNTTSRMKVADLLSQEGMEDDAIAEYEAVAEQLGRQDSPEAVVGVYARILEIRPKRVATLVASARALIDLKKPDKAEPFAKRAVEVAPNELEHCELLSEIYTTLDRSEDLEATTRKIADIYKSRGDEDRAREILQRLPSAVSMEALSDGADFEGLGGSDDLEDLGAPAAAVPDIEGFGAAGADDGLSDDDLLDDDHLGVEGAADFEADELMLDEKMEAPSPGAATGSASDALPEGEPDQLLAEASVYMRYGKPDQAIANLRSILAQEPEHRNALKGLADAYAEQGDEATAVELWIRAAERARAEGDDADLSTLCERIRPIDADAAAEFAPAEAEVAAPDLDLEAESEDVGNGGVEVELGDEGQELEVEVTAGDEVEVEVGGGDEVEIELDGGGDEGDADDVDPIAAKLEEADHFFQQGELDQAEAIYQAILKETPNRADALMKLCEVTAARNAPLEEAGGAEVEIDVGGEESAPISAPTPEPTPPPAPAPVAAPAPPAPAPVAAAPKSAQVTVEDGEDSFDLAAELRSIFEDDESGQDSNETSGVLSTVEDGFESIFSEFKRGVSEQLSEGDQETRYDLGIAYKEMGLPEDAIAEFRVCLSNPKRVLDSLHMMGLCALDLGRTTDAINHFEQALANEGLPSERRVGLTFELGRALEVAGDPGRAKSAYQSVAETEPSFPGIQERIAAIDDGGGAPPAPAADEEFENFDDFTGEMVEESYPEESDTESFESFDDVLISEDSIPAAGAPGAGNAPEQATPKKGGKRPPRKKKISFV